MVLGFGLLVRSLQSMIALVDSSRTKKIANLLGQFHLLGSLLGFDILNLECPEFLGNSAVLTAADGAYNQDQNAGACDNTDRFVTPVRAVLLKDRALNFRLLRRHPERVARVAVLLLEAEGVMSRSAALTCKRVRVKELIVHTSCHQVHVGTRLELKDKVVWRLADLNRMYSSVKFIGGH